MELVSWAIFLMHEYLIKDVARKEFCELKGLLRVLLFLLAEESCIPRIILRSLKCLGTSSDTFQLEMISAEVVKKVLPFLKSNDEECQYWAFSLLHDLMGYSESHEEFLSNKGISAISHVCLNRNPSIHIALFMADIFVFLSGNAVNYTAILESNVLDCVAVFVRMPDHDVQYGGITLYLTLTTVSDSMVSLMIENGVLELVTDLLLDSSSESVQIVSAKTLTVIAKKSISI